MRVQRKILDQRVFFVLAYSVSCSVCKLILGGVGKWVARLTRNVEVVGSNAINSPRCLLE